MVSHLWLASADGDIVQVESLLKKASLLDIEIKDEAGATSLVQAVKNNHAKVVKALLDAGADPNVSSSHGSLEQLTTDASILALLVSARGKTSQAESATASYLSTNGYSREYPDASKAYYPAPHGPYLYYPPYHPGAPVLPDGTPAPYFSQRPPPLSSNNQPGQPEGTGGSNLPPPEIARLIPCRYFPACRYGPSCIFAHPQGPYFQGPLPPPAQYPTPYDPIAQPPYGGYYGVPQVPYNPNGTSPASNVQPSPAPHPNHMRSNSEVVSPIQAPFSPTGAPALPYPMPVPVPYSQNQMPPPPIPVNVGPLSPPQSAMSPVQSNGVIYSPTSPTSITKPVDMHRRDPSIATSQNGLMSQAPALDGTVANRAQPVPPQQEGYVNITRSQHRDGLGHTRRGSTRRPFPVNSNRKPPCAFFPSGRCRNGDSCRFPHVLPDAGDTTPGNFSAKNSGPRGKTSTVEPLTEKMSALNTRSESATTGNGPGTGNPAVLNGVSRVYYPNGNVKGIGTRHDKRNSNNGNKSPHPQQRVPNADDFPVLAGTVTPPSRSPGGTTMNGLTAAQVLQAPAPIRKDPSNSRSQSVTAGLDGDSPEESIENDGSINVLQMNGINGQDANSPTFAAAAAVSAPSPEAASAVPISA